MSVDFESTYLHSLKGSERSLGVLQDFEDGYIEL